MQMKILVLSKRQYMGKDLLDDRFGRFWELPWELARLGHEVKGIALSYRRRPEAHLGTPLGISIGKLTWHSFNLCETCLPAPQRYFRFARHILSDFQPDVVWACSDAYHAILGHRLTRPSTSRLIIDLYDNFESYPATWFPGVLPLFRRAVRAAQGLTLVSAPLAGFVRERYRSSAPQLILENAVRADLFRPMERMVCRKQLALPLHAKIIGTAGALLPSRGIQTLFRAFQLLTADHDDLHLAFCGPRPPRAKLPKGDRVHDLGTLPLDNVPYFLNALDVAIVCNRESAFGRYNFPQKTREIMACAVPLVAAAVGSAKDALRETPECLFKPDDARSLAQAVHAQLLNPIPPRTKVPSWSDIALRLQSFFMNELRGRG